MGTAKTAEKRTQNTVGETGEVVFGGHWVFPKDALSAGLDIKMVNAKSRQMLALYTTIKT